MKANSIKSFPVFVLLVMVAANAGVVPGRWEKVDVLISDTEIVVCLDSGEKLTARYRESNADRIRVLRADGSEIDLPKDAIERVMLSGVKENDPVWNGLAIGAAAGAGTYLIGHAVFCCAPNGAHDVAGAAFTAAIGMGIGALIDATVRGDEVLYRAR